jgi:GNAT superfamily N-acetyltransferase
MIRISASRAGETAGLAALWDRAVLAQGEAHEITSGLLERLDAVVHEDGLSFEIVVARDRSEVVGFALGCAQKAGAGDGTESGSQPGWLSGVAVEPSRWRQGIGRRLLRGLEQAFVRQGKTVVATQTFRMPVSLLRRPYLDSAPYRFLISCGYRPLTHELYLRNNLERFHLSDEVKRRREVLSAEGIHYRMYEPGDRAELLELVGRYFPAGWHATIERATADDCRPVIFVVRAGGQIVGFMGPLDIRQPRTPGRFGSPGVDPAFRGRGIGKVLINLSLDYLKKAEVSEVRYSTGLTNPARFTYFDSGAELLGVYCSSFRKSLPAKPRPVG